MRVLFVARNIPVPGHRENDIVLQLAKQLNIRGRRVAILFPAEWLPIPQLWLSGILRAISRLERSFVVDGIDIRVLKYVRLPFLSISYLFSGFFWLKEESEALEFVHAHYVMPDGWIGMRVSKRSGCPLAVTVRQGDMVKFESMPNWAPVKAMYRHVLSKADVVFSPSHSIVKQLHSLGFSAELMPHGVDDAEQVERRTVRQGVVRVLVAASLIPSKRVDWVVRALSEYRGENSVELVVLGEGECLSELKELALRHALDAKFLGHVCRKTVFREMQQADVFALPSVRETFGLVYLEAALRECAVLAIKGTGVDGCFEHGTEIVFSTGDFDSYRDDLWSLIDDGDKRELLAKNARLRARRDYLWSVVIDNYVATMAKAG